ncbi:lytic murein transglycosylase [Breoghania corrubedonensis]|uniref:Lytic murein transglycosylase n=1 Tax=Breoghania corrubedonensis TaxID=665038 RepID=A0A2T5UN64_9HYPH|nr:lytic murein transglycosylase [Breoghania corrubedonensis]PTW52949.1 lytic murein transglycosylase [Breoghania corrubedonensis]
MTTTRTAAGYGAIFAAALLAVIPAHAASLKSCVDGLRRDTIAAGVPRTVADQALANVSFDEKAVRFSRTQPEYKTEIWDYMAFLVDRDRVRDGRALMKRHMTTLAQVQKRIGVDRYIVAALWGVETDYGRKKGDFFIPHALANVICLSGRRADYFKGELITALKIVAAGDIHLKDLKGSWAGAFGQTQFMPSTYRRLAVDFDGDGHKDLVNSTDDALASAANYLKKASWDNRLPWGFEVILPKGYDGPSGRKKRAALSTWASRGVRHINGSPPKGNYSAGLLLPAGRNGPAFLVTSNFDALYSYNVAESYALAIGHLSDRLRGHGPLETRWPTDDPGLSREQRLDLQRRLMVNGYDIGKPDGLIGPATQNAIRKAEIRLGMEPTGRPGTKIYRALGGTK